MRKYPKEFKQYMKRAHFDTSVSFEHKLFLAWSNGYKRGLEDQRASSDNLMRKWAFEKEIEDRAESMAYDIKSQMLCAAQNFIKVTMEGLDE
jgi:hypothetical protein